MSTILKNNHLSTKKLHSQSQQAYYSTTQANFFKAYAHQIQFVNRLSQLLGSIQKRKVIKVIDQVKSGNKVFRKYLNQRRIIFIKIDDVIAFEQLYQKQNFLLLNTFNSSSNFTQLKKSCLPAIRQSQIKKKQSRLSTLGMSNKSYFEQGTVKNISLQSKQMIKKGFMNFLQKLEYLKKQQFINQSKYLQSILARQTMKLKSYEFKQDQFGLLQKKQKNYIIKLGVVDEIQKQQKINGLYPIIMKNVRQQTLAIQKVQRKYQDLMKN